MDLGNKITLETCLQRMNHKYSLRDNRGPEKKVWGLTFLLLPTPDKKSLPISAFHIFIG